MNTSNNRAEKWNRTRLVSSCLLSFCITALIATTGCNSQRTSSPTFSRNDNIDKRTDKQKVINAIFRNDIDTLKQYADAGIDVDFKDFLGRTSMHQAACFGSADVIIWLANHGADITARDHYGATPLHAASQYGKLQAVRALLDQGASTKVVNNYGFTPLHWAAGNRYFNVALFLLNHGADPVARDNIKDLTPAEFVLSTTPLENADVARSKLVSDKSDERMIFLLDTFAVK